MVNHPPEFSAATYRLFASKAKTTKGRDRYLAQSGKARAAGFPKKAAGTITPEKNGPQWDYRDTKWGGSKPWGGGATPMAGPPASPMAAPGGTRGPGGARPGRSMISTQANASTMSTGGPPATVLSGGGGGGGGFFGSGSHKATTPTMRAANSAWKTGRKAAGTTYNTTMATNRAALKAGTLSRKDFTAAQRTASKARQTTVKAGRATIRTARGKFVKGTEPA